MNPTVKISLASVVACFLVGQPTMCFAQEAPPRLPPASEADGKVVGRPPVDSGKIPQEADLSLLAKAMQTLGRSTSFFYEGDIEIKGVGKGLTFTGRERVRFTAKRPGKVRSDVMVTLGDAASGKRYLTISDGTQVSVERPGTRQYSIGKFSATEFTKNLTGLGILGALYFNADLLLGIGMITPENAAQFVELLKKEKIELSGDIEAIDGVETPVYTMLLAKQKMTFRFFVDAKQAVIRRLEVTANDKGMDFTMTETVVRQNPAPPLTKGIFKFVPTAGHSKTERVTVELL